MSPSSCHAPRITPHPGWRPNLETHTPRQAFLLLSLSSQPLTSFTNQVVEEKDTHFSLFHSSFFLLSHFYAFRGQVTIFSGMVYKIYVCLSLEHLYKSSLLFSLPFSHTQQRHSTVDLLNRLCHLFSLHYSFHHFTLPSSIFKKDIDYDCPFFTYSYDLQFLK